MYTTVYVHICFQHTAKHFTITTEKPCLNAPIDCVLLEDCDEK